MVLASIDIDYVTLRDLKAETITWPIGANVVAGEEAANRIPSPTVTVARLIAEANQAKAEASEALPIGDSARAATLMDAASNNLKAKIEQIPDDAVDTPRLRARIFEEQAQAVKLAESAREREADLARKSSHRGSQRHRTWKRRRDAAAAKAGQARLLGRGP